MEQAVISATGLCERCRADDLEGVLDGNGWDHLDRWRVSYELTSFQDSCTICTQFATVVANCKALDEKCLKSRDTKWPIFSWANVSKTPDTLQIAIAKVGLRSRLGIAMKLDYGRRKVDLRATNVSRSSTAGAHPKISKDGSSETQHILTSLFELHKVQYERIAGWLQHCQQHHLESCCRLVAKRTMEVLTVIDCRTRSLCEIQSQQPYIALSYVWGKESYQESPNQGQLPERLPRTISDAMSVALALGVSYLWVDRYCINQNNCQEKDRMIRHMDQVYRGAFLTIIASAGNGPHHGLPGVSQTQREPLNRIVIGPYTLLEAWRTWTEISNCVWRTRGWTYQEALLSRRRLVFAESEVYFQCLDMFRFECDPSKSLIPSYANVFPEGGIGLDVFAIYDRIKEYCSKQLSNPDDKLNALQGVFSAFEGMECEKRSPIAMNLKANFWGVPIFSSVDMPGFFERISFASGLLFHYFLPRRTCNTNIPTWSWAFRDSYSVKFHDRNLAFADIDDDWTACPGRAVPEWPTSLIYATHSSGIPVEIDNITRISQNYKDFRPCLDITSWSLWTAASQSERCSFETFCYRGRSERVALPGSMRFDNGIFNDWHEKELLAVYIRAYVDGTMSHKEPFKETTISGLEVGVRLGCLLLEQVSPGTFRRVGVWSMGLGLDCGSMSIDEFFTKYCKPTAAGADEVWKKRTVHVI